MKITTVLVFAGATLAFCGCSSADGPIFSNDASKQSATNANPSVQEQSRDIQNYQNNNPYNMGAGVNGGAAPNGGNAPAASQNQMGRYGQ